MILIVQEGREAGRQIRLDRGLLKIGRGGDCDWSIQDTAASRYHAELRRYGDQWLIVDLGSTNGTFAGTVRLQAEAARPLPPGEPVTIGSTRFILQREPQDDAPGETVPQQLLGEWAEAPAPVAAVPSSPAWDVLAWLSRAIVVAGCAALAVGSVGDWVQVEVVLPLVGKVIDRTFGGMDTSQGWLFLGVAGIALLLFLLDVLSRRWGLAAGLGQALAGVVAAASVALSFYRYYEAGTQQIWGISLLDVFSEYARNVVHLTVKPGIYLVAGGLAALILGGLLRLVVAGLAPMENQ
jgi:hypothetical protein